MGTNSISGPRRPGQRAAWRIALIYAAIGALWIVGSDWLVGLISPDLAVSQRLQTYKGWFYVAITALVLFVLIRRVLLKLQEYTQRLGESNERMAAILDYMPALLEAYDAHGRLVVWNKECERVTGYTMDEVVQQPELLAAMYPDGAQEAMDERRIVCKDGAIRTVALGRPSAAHPVPGWPRWYVGVDITERKLAEEALHRSEQLYRNLVETMNEGLYVADKDGVVTYANRRLTEMIRLPLDQILGRRFFEFVHADDQPVLMKQWERRKKGIATPYEFEWRLCDGRRITALISPSILRDTQGGFAGTVAVIADLTKLKDLEDRIARAEKMESLGRLAGGVAHDLNNVLTGLVSYPDLLLSELDEDSSLREPLQTIKKSGQRAAGIVEDLLALARRGVTQRTPVNLNTILRDLLASPELGVLQRESPAVRVDLALDEALLSVNGSAVHLGKAILNLIVNAYEAMHGAGAMFLRTRNEYVEVPSGAQTGLKEGEYAVLEIQDTGSGMSEDDVRHIFEPFYTKKILGRSGSGLGLTVVWGVVADHQGHIAVQSEPGRGTTFTVYLPATRDVAAPIGAENAAIPFGAGERVLVVDDIEEQRTIACRMLETIGYSAEAVATGEEAVEYVRQTPIDLALLDMIMENRMDGLDTFIALRNVQPALRAVIASGYAETERVYEAQRLGAGGYIKKPYTLETLAQAVHAALAKH